MMKNKYLNLGEKLYFKVSADEDLEYFPFMRKIMDRWSGRENTDEKYTYFMSFLYVLKQKL